MTRLRRLFFLLLLVLLVLSHERWGKVLFPFPYREAIARHASARGLDPYLVAALIKTESNFNPRATSPRGARGLMQVMPETGSWVASQLGLTSYHPDLLYDPEFNLAVGTWYLADLYRTFGQDTVLALAAYNGGRGNVLKWLEERQWTGGKNRLDQIPYPETRQFVRKVLWHYQVYRYLYGREKP